MDVAFRATLDQTIKIENHPKWDFMGKIVRIGPIPDIFRRDSGFLENRAKLEVL